MSKKRIRCFISLMCLTVFLLSSRFAVGQTNSPAPDAEQAPYHLNVSSNLVVLRVVVRDEKGNPVPALKKEDFKLFDRGKEQTISHFEEQSSASVSVSATSAGPSSQTAPVALPERFLALYFDDLNTSEADMMQARDAADHFLASHLQPHDRVAIFTATAMLSDFTADAAQIHQALFRLHSSPRSVSRSHDCPQLSDYQALQISESMTYDANNDAWKVALDEKLHCSNVAPNARPEVLQELENEIQSQARQVVEQANALTRSNLDGLDRSVKSIAQMPGQRTVILVSPGFMTQSEQLQQNRIIDHALRSQVVISSLDPKGLAVMMREADASQRSVGTADLAGAIHSVDKSREMIASEALAEIAHGTGGEFLHDDNDLKAGFNALSGSPAYYILAFSPTDLKLDGKYHALRVTLADKRKGISIQARRGYFAAKEEPEPAVVDNKNLQPTNNNSSSTNDATHELIREALYSKTDLAQLEVSLEIKPGAGKCESCEVAVTTHLDGKDLPFRKEGGSNFNTVTFVFGIFDLKGNLLAAQQRHTDLAVSDAQLAEFLHVGISEAVSFQLKPGNYRLRAVVLENEQHHMSALSRVVKLPQALLRAAIQAGADAAVSSSCQLRRGFTPSLSITSRAKRAETVAGPPPISMPTSMASSSSS